MLWIGLFLTSLNDYYVPAISGSPLPVLGLLFLAFHCGRFNQLRWLEQAYVLVIILSFIVGFYRLSTDLAVEVKFTNGIGWLVGFGALLIDLQTRKDELENALRVFLIIHVVFFFLQGVVYVAPGVYIDPIAYVTGETSRYLAETVTLRTSVFSIRPTGFFIEPSNYAVHILPITFLYYSHTKRMTPVIGMAVASVALTFSSWAFIAVAVSVLMFARRLRSQIWFALATWLFVYTFADWFMTRTFNAQYGAGTYWARQEFAGLVLWRVLELSPGLGIGVYRPWDVNVPWDANTINDSGVLIYLLYVFGINALLLLVPLFACINGWRSKFFLVIILTSKLSPAYPFFWILINLLSRQANEREHPGSPTGVAGAPGGWFGLNGSAFLNTPKHRCSSLRVTAATICFDTSSGWQIVGKCLMKGLNRNAVSAGRYRRLRSSHCLPQKLKQKILFGIFPHMRRNQGFPSYYNRCTPKDFRDIARENGFEVKEEKHYYMSAYFSFLFPLYLLWRLWILGFHFLRGAQASETFSMALLKHSNEVREGVPSRLGKKGLDLDVIS